MDSSAPGSRCGRARLTGAPSPSAMVLCASGAAARLKRARRCRPSATCPG
ncbi:hypothetical protein APY03_2646 [Variovorax sp. WDL1]|nr:hypothetical protein APY03_2646 [Variovorax sp. WDL1]